MSTRRTKSDQEAQVQNHPNFLFSHWQQRSVKISLKVGFILKVIFDFAWPVSCVYLSLQIHEGGAFDDASISF